MDSIVSDIFLDTFSRKDNASEANVIAYTRISGYSAAEIYNC